jgi:hypothetical protein
VDVETIKWIVTSLKEVGVNAVLALFLIGAMYLYLKKQDGPKQDKDSPKDDDTVEDSFEKIEERCSRNEGDIKHNASACERRVAELHEKCNKLSQDLAEKRNSMTAEISREVRAMADSNYTAFSNLTDRLGKMAADIESKYIQDKHLGSRVKELIREHCDQCNKRQR